MAAFFGMQPFYCWVMDCRLQIVFLFLFPLKIRNSLLLEGIELKRFKEYA